MLLYELTMAISFGVEKENPHENEVSQLNP
jgi:hypothetical protein